MQVLQALKKGNYKAFKTMVLENYKKVRKNVDDICNKCGRDPSEVLLLAVSKTKPKEDIMELYNAGVRDFGENYVQELREKHEDLPKDIRWHMIGHLQRNKVKYIAEYVDLIHSVDSYELAETIDKEAKKHERVIPVLIEVNAGEEDSKFGLSIKETPAFVESISGFSNIKIRGFMTSAPYTDDTELLHDVFRSMRELILDTKVKNHNNYEVNVLSMGMSNDYNIAIEEGSTIVRVGTDIFGARHYNKA